MGARTVSQKWFAVQTKPGQECLAKANFERQGFEVFLPVTKVRVSHARKISWQPRPFFASYLFLHLSPEQQRWSTIRSTVGAVGAVHFGAQFPALPEMAISLLKEHEDEAGFISLERTVEQPFLAGDRVRIQAGPMRGFEGVFVEMRAEDRALVLLDWVQRSMHVQISPAQIMAA